MNQKTKICSKCKKEKDIKYFHKDIHKKDGLYSTCKICRSGKIEKDYFLEIKNNEKGLKKCSVCKKYKIKKKFNKNKNTKDYLDSVCKICRKNYRNFLVKFNSKLIEQLHKYKYEIKNNNGFLEIRCKKCNKFFIPTNQQVQTRLQAIKGNRRICSEDHLYCSDGCKNACNIFGKHSDYLIKRDEIKSKKNRN